MIKMEDVMDRIWREYERKHIRTIQQEDTYINGRLIGTKFLLHGVPFDDLDSLAKKMAQMAKDEDIELFQNVRIFGGSIHYHKKGTKQVVLVKSLSETQLERLARTMSQYL